MSDARTLYRNKIELPVPVDNSPQDYVESQVGRLLGIKVSCVNYEDSVATILSPCRIMLKDVNDSRSEEEMSSTQRQILKDIEVRWGFDGEWTNKDVLETTDATESRETVKKATRTLEEKGYATTVNNDRHGKVRSLVHSHHIEA